MPTTATSPRLRRYRHEPEHAHPAGETAFSRIALRLRVAVHASALTSELAAGAPPGLSPELSVRATQLVGDRGRRQMAQVWRRTIDEARRPALTRANISIIHRAAVIDAGDAISALIERLNSDKPVAVKGMAMLEMLLTDGAASPLYAPAEPLTLRHRILVATEALDPNLAGSPLTA
jgi:hypothetical protein